MTVTFYDKRWKDLTVYKDITKMESSKFCYILHKGETVTISVRRRYRVLLSVEEDVHLEFVNRND